MSTFVTRIRLRKPRRVLDFVGNDASLNRDDALIVQTDRGLEWGTCALPPEPCSEEFADKCEMKVIRRATQHDQRTFVGILDEERQARQICLERIQRRGLEMKLVDVEYTFDKRKIVFFFTADERVDFRELVRDLAHDLRARIELRHIQVRDEAKMVGGLGCCGRQLCCASWLAEFMPISMRMAKRQNLSLNPAKISGQCGRLLCCLSYENDQYESSGRRKSCPAECPGHGPRQTRDADDTEGDFGDESEAERPRQAPQQRREPAREQRPPKVIVYDPEEEEEPLTQPAETKETAAPVPSPPLPSPPVEPAPLEEEEVDDGEDEEEDDTDELAEETTVTEESTATDGAKPGKADKHNQQKPRRRGKRGGKRGGRH